MVKKWRSALSVLALAGISSALLFAANTNAENAVFQAVVEDYLSLELNNSHMEVNISPNTPFASGYVIATVNTNAAAGYTLSFQDVDSRNGLEREGYDEATDKSPFNIPSVSADTTYANLAADTWGYFLGNTTDTEATYKQIPLTATEVASDDEPAADATAKVNFGVKISDTRPSGVYEDTLTFTLTANVVDPDPGVTTFDEAYAAAGKSRDANSGKYKLQDMNSSICEAVSMSSEADFSDTQETQLVDIRDGKQYWVAKLLDGHCWMTQNLDLDLVSVGENETPLYNHWNTDIGWYEGYEYFGGSGIDNLTQEDIEEKYPGSYDTLQCDDVYCTVHFIINTNATWNPSKSTTHVASESELPNDDDSYAPRSTDVGNWYYTDTYTPLTDKSLRSNYNYLRDGANTFFSTTPYINNGMHGHLGNYYNWNAATADNNSYYLRSDAKSPTSICPAGWRLPKSSSYDGYGGKHNFTDPQTDEVYPDVGLTEMRQTWFTDQQYGWSADETLGIKIFYNNGLYDTSVGFESAPIYWMRAGTIRTGGMSNAGFDGYYWTNEASNYYQPEGAIDIMIRSNVVEGDDSYIRDRQRSVRCVAR